MLSEHHPKAYDRFEVFCDASAFNPAMSAIGNKKHKI